MNNLLSTEARGVRDQGDVSLADAAREREIIRQELLRLAASVHELSAERDALLERVNRAEARVKALTITSADEIVAGMRDWLTRDSVGLANAVRDLVRQAVQ